MSFSKASYLNPFFYWRKRRSIANRVYEFPGNVLWSAAYAMYRRGYIENQALSKSEYFADMNKGREAFLIGNGPSVRVEDLIEIKNAGYVTFCFNRINLIYENSDFRPDYVTSSDEQMISDFGAEMAAANRGRMIFVSKENPRQPESFWFFLKKSRNFRFYTKPQGGLSANGGSLVPAMQIAYYMGIRKLYLYGVDHNFNFEPKKGIGRYKNAVGEGNHFIKDYRGGLAWQAPTYELVEDALSRGDQVFRRDGGFIKNATHGGRLEVLERVALETLIKAPEICPPES